MTRLRAHDPVVYLAHNKTRISHNNFLRYLDHLSKGTLNALRSVISAHMRFFPDTKVQGMASLQNQKFADELTQMLHKLLNNRELNLVQNYLRELIKSVEENLIIDKRSP